jgi:two-component system, OmpR family, osmolarity sensor histidine kinase EnvZ
MRILRLVMPKTLFARIALLVLVITVLSQTIAWATFRYERERTTIQQFSRTKIAQIFALKHTIETESVELQEITLLELATDYGATLIPLHRKDDLGTSLRTAPHLAAVEQIRAALGDGTEVRLTYYEGSPMFWLRLVGDAHAYWVGFPAQEVREAIPLRPMFIVAACIGFLLLLGYLFARRAVEPLRSLTRAANAIRENKATLPVPETGPDEIANVAREFNRMRESLARVEEERALMLAGVSHDIRTPLTRIKLELEMTDVMPLTKTAIALDIEEIERTLGQFLDLARTTDRIEKEAFPVDVWLAERIARERVRRGEVVTFNVQENVEMVGNVASLDRAVANLIDNAFRYGSEDIHVAAFRDGEEHLVIEIADRGPGISPDDVPRLLQPFTRGDPARSNTGGSGLGLAIVQRIANLHGGTLSLSPREGGGTIARVRLPLQ